MEIIAEHISCVCLPGEFAQAVEQGYKQIYVMTTEGIMKHHALRGTNRFVRLKVTEIPGYKPVEIKPALSFLPAGKIPYVLYEQVLGFFRKIMEVKSSELEAMIHILYNPERGYHLGVPPQTISKASVQYDWSYIPDGTSIIVDIHSHNTMGAFFSGTDNNDDRNNVSFSGVFGKLKDKEPMTVWRFNYYAQKFEAKGDDIFDMPEIPEVEVPQEWLDQVKTFTYLPKHGGTRDQGNVHSFPKGAKDPRNYPSTNQGSYPKGYVSGSETGAFEGGDQGTFFGHEYDVHAEYLHSQGVVPVATPKGRINKASKDPFSNFVYDSQAGRYILKDGVEPPPDSADDLQKQLDAEMQKDAEGESHLGKSQVENLNTHPEAETEMEMNLDQILDARGLVPGFTDGRYEELANEHGVDVADAWQDIDNAMGWLDGKDDLCIDLISDMFNFISEENQPKLISALFEQLPRRQREKIEQNGL